MNLGGPKKSQFSQAPVDVQPYKGSSQNVGAPSGDAAKVIISNLHFSVRDEVLMELLT